MSRVSTIALTLLRWVVGATFLFSGIAKCIDPVGSAIYVDKYLATYALDAFMPLSQGIAIALMVVETLLGVWLIFGTFSRFTTLASLVIISFFTVVTLLSATVLPIGECGCFGDIVELTPWQTFLKNILLLALCIALWHCCGEKRSVSLKDVVVTLVGIALPLAVSLYALRHLPFVDSMPYKVGTSLFDEVSKERDMEQQSVQNVLIFKNLTTGESVEFDAADTSCWEDANLEFVDALTREIPVDATYAEFRLYDAEGEDYTLDVLARKGRVALLCVNDVQHLNDKHQRGISSLLNQYPSEGIVLLSAVDMAQVEGLVDEGIATLTVDAMTLRSVIRSDVGVVVLHDGVVEFKSDIRDI